MLGCGGDLRTAGRGHGGSQRGLEQRTQKDILRLDGGTEEMGTVPEQCFGGSVLKMSLGQGGGGGGGVVQRKCLQR